MAMRVNIRLPNIQYGNSILHLSTIWCKTFFQTYERSIARQAQARDDLENDANRGSMKPVILQSAESSLGHNRVHKSYTLFPSCTHFRFDSQVEQVVPDPTWIAP
jgi:hypothetical protein